MFKVDNKNTGMTTKTAQNTIRLLLYNSVKTVQHKMTHQNYFKYFQNETLPCEKFS